MGRPTPSPPMHTEFDVEDPVDDTIDDYEEGEEEYEEYTDVNQALPVSASTI